MKKKIHFIAIGGSVMHQIAIMMKQNGYAVTGSDDDIFEPALSNLKTQNIIDDNYHWSEAKISPSLDAVILGMHAHADNLELKKAQALALKIYSFPEYIYEQTQHKKRIIVGGSHGKTTTTAMIIHVLYTLQKPCDYLVGAKVLNLEYGISLTKNTEVFVGEGDEYLASKLMPQPKFHFYKPHIAVLTGIAWDHINVFPTLDFYIAQFAIFINTIEPNGYLIYNEADDTLKELVEKNERKDLKKIPYTTYNNYINAQDEQIVSIDGQAKEMNFFGLHNFQNLAAAYKVCQCLGIASNDFLNAMAQFKGVDKRLQLIISTPICKVFRDFAHSPSKVKASVNAIKQRFYSKKIIAVYELHTYSSLNENFLKEYKNTLIEADIKIIYFSAHALALKKLPPLNPSSIQAYFNANDAQVISYKNELEKTIINLDKKNSILLMMSSGNFDNTSFSNLLTPPHTT